MLLTQRVGIQSEQFERTQRFTAPALQPESFELRHSVINHDVVVAQHHPDLGLGLEQRRERPIKNRLELFHLATRVDVVSHQQKCVVGTRFYRAGNHSSLKTAHLTAVAKSSQSIGFGLSLDYRECEST